MYEILASILSQSPKWESEIYIAHTYKYTYVLVSHRRRIFVRFAIMLTILNESDIYCKQEYCKQLCLFHSYNDNFILPLTRIQVRSVRIYFRRSGGSDQFKIRDRSANCLNSWRPENRKIPSTDSRAIGTARTRLFAHMKNRRILIHIQAIIGALHPVSTCPTLTRV